MTRIVDCVRCRQLLEGDAYLDLSNSDAAHIRGNMVSKKYRYNLSTQYTHVQIYICAYLY